MKVKIKILFRWLIVLAVFASIVTALYITVLFFTVNPPSMEMEMARKAVSKAKKSHADIYAPELFVEAKNHLTQALLEWRRQNELYFYQRNFTKCKNLAVNATITGEESYSKSGINKNNLRDNYISDVKVLNEKLDAYHKTFISLPLTSRVRKDYEFGKLNLAESLSAFEKNDYKTASAKLAKCKSRIAQSDLLANGFLKEYFSNYNNWKSWYNSAVQRSKDDGINVIVVNKFEHKLYVYFQGNRIAEFDVEFGKNWLGPKQARGDYATPEGEYQITKKKDSKDTKYYKAMCINYPNARDSQRMYEMKRKGLFPKNKDIGGLIEVHGDGGRGADWTEGCIALKNSEMERLFQMVPSGTPITIIGSLKPLNDILN